MRGVQDLIQALALGLVAQEALGRGPRGIATKCPRRFQPSPNPYPLISLKESRVERDFLCRSRNFCLGLCGLGESFYEAVGPQPESPSSCNPMKPGI